MKHFSFRLEEDSKIAVYVCEKSCARSYMCDFFGKLFATLLASLYSPEEQKRLDIPSTLPRPLGVGLSISKSMTRWDWHAWQ